MNDFIQGALKNKLQKPLELIVEDVWKSMQFGFVSHAVVQAVKDVDGLNTVA